MEQVKYKLRKKEIAKVKLLSYEVLKSMGDGLALLDSNGDYIFVNRSFEKLTCYKNAELVGKNVRETIKKLVAPYHLEKGMEMINRVLGGKMPQSENLNIITKNDKEVFVAFSVSSIKYKKKLAIIILSVKDVTHQQKSEDKLWEAQLFRSLAENIREVFYIHDSTAKTLLYISPSYEHIWGRSCESLYKDPIDWINSIHPEDRNRINDAWWRYAKKGKFSEEYKIIRPEGSMRWIWDRAVPVRDSSGKVSRIVGIAEDITDRKRAEENLKEKNRELILKTIEANELKEKFGDKNFELQQAIKSLNEQNMDITRKTMDLTELRGQLEDKNFELEQANKEILKLSEERIDFINKSAHDLRTPITPILILIPTIKSHIKDKDVLKDIEVIERNAKYLKRIANNLISYLKSKTGKYNYIFKKNNIGALIEEVIKTYEESFNQKNISLIKQIPTNLPLIELDDLKIREVIQNIIANAFKFTKEGGKLIISIKKMDSFINVKFKDTGRGMSKDTLSKVFQEFFKADISRHSVGEGLGLSICKEIIEKHDGVIRAESQGLGKGSTISFDIPISQKVVANEEQTN